VCAGKKARPDCAQGYTGAPPTVVSQAGVSLYSFGPIKAQTCLSGAVAIFKTHKLAEQVRAILAAHADESLALLPRPTALQDKLLAAFRYQANETVLHTDTTVMPKRRLAWAAWNYRMEPSAEGERPSTHYYMNRLQGVSDRADYFVSLNYADRIDPAKVLWRTNYTHPIFDRAALAAQHHLPSINAESRDQRVFFSGSYLRYGFHEDARAAADTCLRVLKQSGTRATPELRGALGRVFGRLGDLERARPFLERALAEGDPRDIARPFPGDILREVAVAGLRRSSHPEDPEMRVVGLEPPADGWPFLKQVGVPCHRLQGFC
jgi:hypothetical protein